MKVIALVSGGKDSCYSMLCCAQHGHTVVALANLLPPDAEVDELDSYMYQTVGHQLVEAYASCTGLPLYRRRIGGGPKSQGLTYSATQGDEVEDLFALLAYVKEHQPDVEAVASGAIASDYQRLRVENVCSRLGLVSLAYLWHRPQEELLRSMISSGIEAVLVKVAALGLDPQKHLGRSLSEMQPTLHALRDRFGCNVCGEGGEYETLTLDCPAFRLRRISLDSWDAKMHSPGSVAPVGVLHPTAFHVETKGAEGEVRGPAGGPPSAAGCGVVEVPEGWQPQAPSPAPEPPTDARAAGLRLAVAVRHAGAHVHVTCSPVGGGGDGGASAAASALQAALGAIGDRLPELGLTWDRSLFVHLYLADMSHFGAANAAYCQHFPAVSPPSRACVQLPLVAGAPLAVDVLFARGGEGEGGGGGEARAGRARSQDLERRVLHVQSISGWAPSCIGPYSQATSHGGLVFLAGQIPLDPGTMAIIPGGFKPQALRALASTQAVAIAAGSCLAAGCLGLTVYLAPGAGAEAREGVAALLRELQADPQRFMARAARACARQMSDGGCCSGGSGGRVDVDIDDNDDEGDEDDEGDVFVDEYLRPPRTALRLRPDVVFLEVPALPRGAMLEVQPLLLDVARGADASPSSSSSDDADRGQHSSELVMAATASSQEAAPATAAPLEPPTGDEAAAMQHLIVQITQSPNGSCARVLLRVGEAVATGGPGLRLLAGAAARQLLLATPGRNGFDDSRRRPVTVRSWCQEAVVDAGEWGQALQAAMGALSGGAEGSSPAVQSVPVISVWGCGGASYKDKQQSCIAVEALFCD